MTATTDPFKEGVEVISKVRHYEAEYSKFGTGAHNAVYGWGKSSDEYVRQSYACHTHLRSFPQYNPPDFIFSKTIYPHKSFNNQDGAKRYFEWLLSSESPWRFLFDLQPDLFSDKELCLDKGFVFTRLDTIPSNLLMNFLIATRMAHEWPRTIKSWDTLVREYGCHPTVSFLFLTLFYPDKFCATPSEGEFFPDVSQFKLNWVNRYDWPVDMVTCSTEYPKNFITGRVSNFNKPFTKFNGLYGPVNKIWGENELPLYDERTYLMEVFKTYGKNYGKYTSETTGSLKGTLLSEHRRWRVSLEELINIIRKEEERLVTQEYRKAARIES